MDAVGVNALESRGTFGVLGGNAVLALDPEA
jgi:molybdopterin biosynthesis enzyme MoaB